MIENLNPPAIHGEQVAGRAARVRKTLKDLSSQRKTSNFDLADLLHEAQENNYYSEWGYASLPDYAAKELGLKPRKAQYLARITKVCWAVGLTRAQYEPVGTSKLRGICTLDPKGKFYNTAEHVNEPMDEHIVRLILDSDTMTVEEVEDEVLRLKGRTGPDRPVIRSTSYVKSVWDNVIKPARELARQVLGSAGRDDGGNAKEYSDGACDEIIYAAFLADPSNGPEPQELPTEKTPEPPTLPMEAI